MVPNLPPTEHSPVDALHDRTSRRCIPALVAFLSIAVAGYLWQGVVHQAWVWSLLGLLVSIGAAIVSCRAVSSGSARTTWGEFNRHRTPIAFWLTVSICLIVYVASVATMFVTQSFSSR